MFFSKQDRIILIAITISSLTTLRHVRHEITLSNHYFCLLIILYCSIDMFNWECKKLSLWRLTFKENLLYYRANLPSVKHILLSQGKDFIGKVIYFRGIANKFIWVLNQFKGRIYEIFIAKLHLVFCDQTECLVISCHLVI